MILDRKHVARELRRCIARRLILLRLQTPPHVLRLSRGVKRLAFQLFELLFELRDMVVLGDLRRALRSLLADFLRLLVQLFVFAHAINLVSAFAVKSTMGTTRS